MRRSLMVFVTLLALAGGAYAQSLGPAAGVRGGAGNEAPCVLGVDDITQSIDCEITPITGVACTGGGIDAGNQFLRRFFLTADDGIVGDYSVDAVQFGVEVADPGSGACAGVPLTFNTYSIAIGADFLYANMTLLDSTTIDATGTAGTIVTAVVGGTVDPALDDLVVEVVTCDSNNNGDVGSFFPGANGLGQTRPTYIASASCSIFDPTDLGVIGFPDSHNVFVVEGTEAGQCVIRLRNPRVTRRGDTVKIGYDLTVQHNRATTQRSVTFELRDTTRNVLAVHSAGLIVFEMGGTVHLKGRFNAPSGLASGWYIVAAKIEGMNGFREVKKLIRID